MSANARRPRRPTEAARTSWDRVAAWYDGWVRNAGSRYHRLVAIPAVLELLDSRPGERILDVGSGQGVLAPYIARAGAGYVGVDASPALVERARRHHRGGGRFLVGDACRLDAVPGLSPSSFDAAVFLFSIQDIDPLDAVLASVAWALRPAGRVVLLMTHPAFRQPRHAGWGFDESRKLAYRRVDAYLTPQAVPMKALPGRAPTRSFHRPLSAYVNGLAAVGFAVDAMLEIPDVPDLVRSSRRSRELDNPDIPLFLALRAVRGGGHASRDSAHAARR